MEAIRDRKNRLNLRARRADEVMHPNPQKGAHKTLVRQSLRCATAKHADTFKALAKV